MSETLAQSGSGGKSRELPAELLHEIMTQLDRNDLAIVAGVSRAFYALATPQLYKEIKVDLERPPHPFSFEMSRDRVHDCSLHTSPRPRPNRFAYTERLHFHAHLRALCFDVPPSIDMPNIHTLRILPSRNFTLADAPPECLMLHHKHGEDSPGCSLISRLRPDTLILASASVHSNPFGSTALTSRPGRWVTHIAIDFYTSFPTTMTFPDILRDLPPTVDWLTLVARPSKPHAGTDVAVVHWMIANTLIDLLGQPGGPKLIELVADCLTLGADGECITVAELLEASDKEREAHMDLGRVKLMSYAAHKRRMAKAPRLPL